MLFARSFSLVYLWSILSFRCRRTLLSRKESTSGLFNYFEMTACPPTFTSIMFLRIAAMIVFFLSLSALQPNLSNQDSIILIVTVKEIFAILQISWHGNHGDMDGSYSTVEDQMPSLALLHCADVSRRSSLIFPTVLTRLLLGSCPRWIVLPFVFGFLLVGRKGCY